MDKAEWVRRYKIQAAGRRALAWQAWEQYKVGKLSHAKYLDLMHELPHVVWPDMDWQVPEGAVEPFGLRADGEVPEQPTLCEHPTPTQIRVTREALGATHEQAADACGVTRGQWVRWETGQGAMRPEVLDRFIALTLVQRAGGAWPFDELRAKVG